MIDEIIVQGRQFNSDEDVLRALLRRSSLAGLLESLSVECRNQAEDARRLMRLRDSRSWESASKRIGKLSGIVNV